MIRRTGLAATSAAIVALAAAVPAQAQGWRFDVGVNGGGSWYRPSLDEDHLAQDFAQARFEAGWLTGGQLTYWVPSVFGIRNMLGIRANFAYAERPFELETDDNERIGTIGDGDNLVEDVNLWSGTGDLLIRFREPAREFTSMEVLPYLALGAGAKWVNPAFNNFFAADGEGEGGTLFRIGDQEFLLQDETKFMGLVGLGTDLRVARNFALRLEAGDRIWDSPIAQVERDEQGQAFVTEEDVGNVIHEIYGQVGLHFLLGLAERERVAVAPAPPAPPAPPAAPAEEAVTVCVIDPNVSGGIREVDAIYVPSTRDTMIVRNGDRVAFRTAHPANAPVYVTNADWYVAGQPLALTIADEEMEWITFGGPRVIQGRDLVLLGTVDGTPLFASRDDAGDLAEQLEDLREAGDDLDEILEQREDLREELNELDVVYVPLETGCVFQPLRRVAEVRKVRG